MSQWADQNRKLSPESSAEPGQWSTDRVPYMREIMDTWNVPQVETIVFKKPTQIAGTETINNIIGYVIDQDPGPTLLVMPTRDLGKAWSKERLVPMLRDTSCLAGKVMGEKAKDADNEILHKNFHGGHIAIAGANSPGGLASRPIRYLFCDEIDKYPHSAGPEGDPLKLAEKRTSNFWNRKHFFTGTPTIKDMSRVESLYESSDKRRCWVPCHACGQKQILKWGQVVWEIGKPETAAYACEHCGVKWTHGDKVRNLVGCEWRAEAPFKGVAGFWLNGLYSPWINFRQAVESYEEAKKKSETYQVWVNTFLAETWEELGVTVDTKGLMDRCEFYGPQVPRKVCLLTCAVDVQDDRLEAEVMGWGLEEESWGIQFKQFLGVPDRPEVWQSLDKFLLQTWEHETGLQIGIGFTCIDSGGHFTQDVYKYVRPRETRRIYAVKGANRPGEPIANRMRRSKMGKVNLIRVGTDTAKSLIYSRLNNSEHGPGYMHFPTRKEAGYDPEYFNQLTAEKATVKKRHGHPYRVWEKVRARNEALDLRVYNLAAFYSLNPDLKKYQEYIERRFIGGSKPIDDDEAEGSAEAAPEEPKPGPRRPPPFRRNRGFDTPWRR